MSTSENCQSMIQEFMHCNLIPIDSFKCQLTILLPEGKHGINSCTVNLSPREKELLLSFSTNGKPHSQPLPAKVGESLGMRLTNGKDPTWCLLAHTAVLNTCPLEVKARPMKTIYRWMMVMIGYCGGTTCSICRRYCQETLGGGVCVTVHM